jgi:hypothetical protein
VSASRKPTGPPPSAGVLARYAQAYARELGVALELRLRDRARATKDIDIVLRDPDLADSLEDALTGEPISGLLVPTKGAATPAGQRCGEHGVRRHVQGPAVDQRERRHRPRGSQ